MGRNTTPFRIRKLIAEYENKVELAEENDDTLSAGIYKNVLIDLIWALGEK